MKMEIKIRKATKKDIPQIIRLCIEFAREQPQKQPFRWTLKRKEHEKTIKGFLKQSRRAIFVAEDREAKGKLVGLLITSMWVMPYVNIIKKIANVEDLFVIKKYRGKGISSQLKDASFKWARAKGAKYVSLFVSMANKKAIKVYRKWQFAHRYLYMVKKL
ncbi:hypothetical protein COS75_03205 [Candidatus Pacearchaeota archaeon CG06_land_8_20_14_3_00_35_12]|nr:MAG: hypothetical protein COS75_03205 [Candidatus Pacearchaeota archaeon CG06_land_8_20_14_3_00_35_12]